MTSPSFIGVKQGNPGSNPVVFFLNDMMENFNNSIDGIVSHDQLNMFIRLFADDSALFSDTPHSLQSLVHDLDGYCKEE